MASWYAGPGKDDIGKYIHTHSHTQNSHPTSPLFFSHTLCKREKKIVQGNHQWIDPFSSFESAKIHPILLSYSSFRTGDIAYLSFLFHFPSSPSRIYRKHRCVIGSWGCVVCSPLPLHPYTPPAQNKRLGTDETSACSTNTPRPHPPTDR